jgi:hypothetical protein
MRKAIEEGSYGDAIPNCVITVGPGPPPLSPISIILFLSSSSTCSLTLFQQSFLAPDLRLSLSVNYNGYDCSSPCAEYQYSTEQPNTDPAVHTLVAADLHSQPKRPFIMKTTQHFFFSYYLLSPHPPLIYFFLSLSFFFFIYFIYYSLFFSLLQNLKCRLVVVFQYISRHPTQRAGYPKSSKLNKIIMSLFLDL